MQKVGGESANSQTLLDVMYVSSLAPLRCDHEGSVAICCRPHVGVDLLVLQQRLDHLRVVPSCRHIQRCLPSISGLVDLNCAEKAKSVGCGLCEFATKSGTNHTP